MTLPKDRRLKINELESIRKAIQDVNIRAVHPDKLEEWAEHLVRKLKQ